MASLEKSEPWQEFDLQYGIRPFVKDLGHKARGLSHIGSTFVQARFVRWGGTIIKTTIRYISMNLEFRYAP